jgi:hypothetical protein
MEAYTPPQLELGTGGPPVAELLYDPAEVYGELQGLDMVIAREVTRDVHEGEYHNGPSAVVQIFAQKP